MAFVIDGSIAAAWAFAEDQVNAELTLARVRTEEARCERYGATS